MDIRNSKEIIQNILERYNFTAIYSDSCNKFGIETSKNYVDGNDAIDFLYSSATIGSKALGFFTELPFFEVTRPLRAECLFITQTLPKYISTPVIIIKNAEDISARLTLALKISVEHKVPVTVVITHNAANNYTDFERANNDLGRISPYISASTFKQYISKVELKETYNTINNNLMQALPADNSENVILCRHFLLIILKMLHLSLCRIKDIFQNILFQKSNQMLLNCLIIFLYIKVKKSY